MGCSTAMRWSFIFCLVALASALLACADVSAQNLPGSECTDTKDGRYSATVHTYEIQLPPGDINVGSTTSNPYGHIYIVDANDTTNCVRWVPESRGETFGLDPVTAFSGSLVPRNLQWDSTDSYLYFEFGGGSATSGVWRVHATNSVPVYVGPTRESFKLLSQPEGPDWVLCSQVRDGKWLWAAYTPEDIAQDMHTFRTNLVDSPLTANSSTRDMIFSGPLGLYGNQIVMRFNQAGGKVGGSYFYAKHGKDLSLEGTVDPSTGHGKMVEQFDGKTTGYFDFKLNNGGMTGTWRATPESKTQPFTLRRLRFSDHHFAAQASELEGFYCLTFETWIYVDGDDPADPPVMKTFTGWNWLRIRYVSGNTFAFYMYALGGNGHQGRIEGLAHMTATDRAEFTAPNILPNEPPVKLGFEIEDDSITVTELQDCSSYRGVTVFFDSTLKRTDEYSVPVAAAP